MIHHCLDVIRTNRICISLCISFYFLALICLNERYGSPIYSSNLILITSTNDSQISSNTFSYSSRLPFDSSQSHSISPLISSLSPSNQTTQLISSSLFNFSDFSSPSSPQKYLYTDIDGWCAGLANMMFRVGSLYGIGKQTHRMPCLQGRCAVEYQKDLHATWPNLKGFPMRTKCWPEKDYAVEYANKDPRIYEDIAKLTALDDKMNLRLRSSYLQQIEFFKDYRKELQEIFKFNEEIDKKVDEYAKGFFNETSSNPTKKVCVHMRRTDFVSNKYLPLLASSIEFTVPALLYVTELARNETNQSISIILFSDDLSFEKDVVGRYKKHNNNTQIYIPEKLSKFENMNLASRFCDYYIVTASGSTYAWWTAYLMDDNRQDKIFYNSKIFRPHRTDSAQHFVEQYFFPEKWRRLVLDSKTESVVEEDRSAIPLIPI